MPRITVTSALLTLSLTLAVSATLVCLLRSQDRDAEALLAQAEHYRQMLNFVRPFLQDEKSRLYREASTLIDQEYNLVQELARVYASTRGLEGPRVRVHDQWGWGVTVTLDEKHPVKKQEEPGIN